MTKPIVTLIFMAILLVACTDERNPAPSPAAPPLTLSLRLHNNDRAPVIAEATIPFELGLRTTDVTLADRRITFTSDCRSITADQITMSLTIRTGWVESYLKIPDATATGASIYVPNTQTMETKNEMGSHRLPFHISNEGNKVMEYHLDVWIDRTAHVNPTDVPHP